MDDEWTWATPETVLGQLQRGRGAGYRRALTAPDGAALVLNCLAHETRWDWQVDSRSAYLLRLVIALDVPAEAIDVDTSDPDLPYGVAFDVLVGLSGRGSVAAAAVLHDYFSRAAELYWPAVDQVWREAGPVARPGLRELVLGRISDRELFGNVRADADGPWRAWADDARVAAALAALRPRAPRRRPDVSALSTAELHVLAGSPSSPKQVPAFRELARRGDTLLLDLAERLDLRNEIGAVGGLAPDVVDLGVPAVPHARAWVEGDDEWLRELGRRVVSAHGDAADAPQLLAWFEEALDDEEWCVSEDLASGLARLSYGPAVQAIVRGWETTPHSYARKFYLSALVTLQAPGVAALLDEALDDCEPDVQEIARAAAGS